MLGNTIVSISGSKFIYNQGTMGGAIAAITISSLNISDGTSFESNSAIQLGDAIYILNCMKSVINDTQFTDREPKNFLYFDTGISLNMSRVSMSSQTLAFINSSKAGVYLSDVH